MLFKLCARRYAFQMNVFFFIYCFTSLAHFIRRHRSAKCPNPSRLITTWCEYSPFVIDRVNIYAVFSARGFIAYVFVIAFDSFLKYYWCKNRLMSSLIRSFAVCVLAFHWEARVYTQYLFQQSKFCCKWKLYSLWIDDAYILKTKFEFITNEFNIFKSKLFGKKLYSNMFNWQNNTV